METSLSIDRVIGEAFALLRRNLATFGLLALLLVALPNYLGAVLDGDVKRFGPFSTIVQFSGIASLLALFTAFLFKILFLRVSLVELERGEESLADAFAGSMRLFLPLLGAAILSWLAMVLGLVALVIPGIMLFCTLSVALPALMREDLGVIGSFNRSSDLTRGQRWRIFVIFLLVWIVEAIAAGIGTLFVDLGGAGVQGQPVLGALIAAAGALIDAPLVASLYVELRNVKEGGVSEGLVAIFE